MSPIVISIVRSGKFRSQIETAIAIFNSNFIEKENGIENVNIDNDEFWDKSEVHINVEAESSVNPNSNSSALAHELCTRFENFLDGYLVGVGIDPKEVWELPE